MRHILLLIVISVVQSLHILQFVPGYSSSHLLFNRRLAQSIAKNGHNVTLFAVIDTLADARVLVDRLPAAIQVHQLIYE